MRTPSLVLAGTCALVLAISGCGLLGGGGGGEEERQGEEQAEEEYPDQAMVRSGLFGMQVFHAELQVHHVERWEDRSVLRFTATPLPEDVDEEREGTDTEASEEDVINPWPWGEGMLDRNHTVFRLLDPVNQRYYYPVRDESGESTLGSEVPGRWVFGAEYHQEVHFPPLPEDVERLTLITMSTAGEFTGVPVVDERPEETPAEFDEAEVEAGDSVTVPPRDLQMVDDPERYGHDLYSVTEGSTETRTSSGETQTIGLHADVLFEFDEATLTDEAQEVLGDVVEETRANADPARPPISIVGHTDGVGSDDYNQELSEERAEAVREVLEEELGAEYEYETEGRGSTEPLVEEGGSDDEEARATNRRVEISYQFRQPGEAEEEVEEGTESTDGRSGTVAPPAPFRPEGVEAVDSNVAVVVADVEYEITVYPLYRDGAYLVGNFDLRHLEDQEGAVSPVVRPLGHRDYPGGRFAGFSLTAPGDETTYRAVRIGPRPEDDLERTNYVDSGRWPRDLLTEGYTERVFVYFPAPPGDVDAVTLDAGPFGEFEGVPVE